MMLKIDVSKVKEVKTNIVITAMICITVLEAYALSQGINGMLLSAVLVILAGIGGYAVPSFIKLK